MPLCDTTRLSVVAQSSWQGWLRYRIVYNGSFVLSLSYLQHPATVDNSSSLAKMKLHEYDYIFAIGTFFAMLDAYNNGASECLRSLPCATDVD